MPDLDPWLTLAEAVTYTGGTSERQLRKCYRLPESHPEHLKAVKHMRKFVKIRRSWLDDWMNRTSEAA